MKRKVKQYFQRSIALMLCVMMLFSVADLSVFATELPEGTEVTDEIVLDDAGNTEGTDQGEELDAEGDAVVTDVTEAEDAVEAAVEAATVEAASTGEQPLAVVYAASDFQPTNDNITNGKTAMNAVINKIKAAGYDGVNKLAPSGAIFCGDYSNIYDTWTDIDVTYNNAGQAAVADVLNEQWGLTDSDVIYVQGNHDPADTQGLDPSGANDTDYYGVYVLHEDDYWWEQGLSTGKNGNGNSGDAQQVIKQTAANLEKYLKDKVEQKYEYPIFVASHVPLHYGWRTYHEEKRDNIYAKYIFDVLNKYGDKLNIIFLFGHNHSSSYDDYLGGHSVYLPVGHNILIANEGDYSSFTKETLKFTYINAGYLGYYGGRVDKTGMDGLTSTIFEIYEDKVVVARYAKSGIVDLKKDGMWDFTQDDRDGAWPVTDLNIHTTYASTQDITLNHPFDVSLNVANLSSGRVQVGKTKELSVEGVYGTTYSTTWSSSNTAVATVTPSADGMTATIEGVAVGEAKITAIVTETGKARAVGDTKTFEYTIKVTKDNSSAEKVLFEKGNYTWFKKVDNFEYEKTYKIVDMETGGPVIGPQMALEYTNSIDTNKENDLDSYTSYSNELNATGIFTYQLPIENGTDTLILPDKNGLSDYSKWKFVENYAGDRTFIQTYITENIEKTYLSLSEGDTGYTYDYYQTDKDFDRLVVIKVGENDNGNTWDWDSERGLVVRQKGDGFKYVLNYSQAQTDFTGIRVDHNGTGTNKLLDEALDSRVYLFEEQTITLNNDITAYVDDVTGYVNRRDNDTTSRMATAQTGDYIIITNGANSIEVPVTTGMLYTKYEGLDTDGNKNNVLVNTNRKGTYSNLTVVYGGQVVTTDYTLEVRDAVVLLENDAERERMDNIYTLVDNLVPGRQYLLVDSNEAGIAHAAGTENPTGNPNYLTAHNVLIQSIPVDGKNMLYIDSGRYSDVADPTTANLVNRGIVDQGDIRYIANNPATSNTFKIANDLIWTATQRAYYPIESYNNKYGAKYRDVIDNSYFFLKHELCDQYLSTSSDTYNTRLDIMGLPNTWEYSGSSGTNFKYTHEYKAGQPAGLGLYSGRDLFYNFQNQHYDSYYDSVTTEADKNFQTANRDELDQASRRRVWIYERVTNIDYITATINDLTGKVTVGRNASALTGDFIIVDTVHADGTVTSAQVNITTGMLSGDNLNLNAEGTYSNLTVTYQGKVITNEYTLVVEKEHLVDNPEFPNEGAVKIDKQLDTSKYNYLESGAAKIDLSVTGIPSQSGVDLVIILDASSSMERCVHSSDVGTKCSVTGKEVGAEGGCSIRMAVMENTLENMIGQLKQPINGYTPDIDIAVASFNGYAPINNDYELNYAASGSGVDHDDAQPTGEDRGDDSQILLPFTNISKIEKDVLNYKKGESKEAVDIQYSKGTNYDRGMELAYDLLKAKQDVNELNNETRQSVVVFMSDGAPYQYNYFYGSAFVKAWDEFITGKMDDNADGDYCTTKNGTDSKYSAENIKNHIPTNTEVKKIYDEYYHTEGKLWMAEAIKGDSNHLYKVIDPDAVNRVNQIDYVRGLNATMYTVGFGLGRDYNVSIADCREVLTNIATPSTDENQYYFEASTDTELDNAFLSIAGTVRSAGNARFVDQMGEKFDLLKTTVQWVDENNNTVSVSPTIEVKKYELYKRSEIGQSLKFKVDGVETVVTVTEAMVGTRKPVQPSVLETIKFSPDGTQAFSSLKGDDNNILTGEVINAETFWYNTSATTKNITLADENNTVVPLEKETFYWNIGDIPQDELVLSYDVYLTGSMEGTRPAGTYDTNTHAELEYKNYFGKECELTVPSPKLPWNQATVGYGFYLVDEQTGQPIINQSSGKTGAFEQSVKITQPIYEDFMLNSSGKNIFANIMAADVLPEGYELYDANAGYDVQLNSNGSGYYKIYTAENIKTTYVVGINPTPITGGGEQVNTANFATANTIVWFGVVANVNCVPDTVVIDYGLPVEINVAANDTMMGNYGAVKYVGNKNVFSADFEAFKTAKPENANAKFWEYLQTVPRVGTPKFDTVTLTLTDGAGTMNVLMNENNEPTGKVKYTPTSMEMKDKETFVYATEYTGDVGTQGYYYSTVTVIPATTIYYEDSFVTYRVYDKRTLQQPEGKTWETVYADGWNADKVNGAVQEEDRPGNFSLSGLDANNLYGSDAAYEKMATYSLGAAKKLTVGRTAGIFGEAQFDFWGTGFDIVSLTSGNTGTITVDLYPIGVYDPDNYRPQYIIKSYIVDTYYGYNYVNGEWIVDKTSTDALYQIPVIKVDDLTYGGYTAVITVDYATMFDHQEDGSYDFYLDAIRIYDPANDGASDAEILEAYKADKEGWPSYFELRNQLIEKTTFDSLGANDVANGMVFIDGNGENISISDYTNYGPNNELYLAPGQAVAFALDTDGTNESPLDVASVQLALKGVGKNVDVKIWDASSATIDKVSAQKIETATDMYYDITDLNNKTVVICNTSTENSGAILSVTNIKTTYNTVPPQPAVLSFRMSRSIAATALASMTVAEEDNTETPVVPDNGGTETPVVPDNNEGTTKPSEKPSTNGTTSSGNTSGNTNTGSGNVQGTTGNNGGSDSKIDVTTPDTEVETDKDQNNTTVDNNKDTSNETVDKEEVKESMSFWQMLWEMIVAFFQGLIEMFA